MKKALEDPILGATTARLTLHSAQQHRVREVSLLDTHLVSSTAPTILAVRGTECHSGSLGRDGTSPCTPSSSVGHRTGVSLESDDPAARSTGHSATAGAVAVQRDSHRGGRSRHIHDGLPDASDRKSLGCK